MIHTRGLTRHFRAKGETVEAVRGIDLDVAAGEWVAVMGPSGCGKSTLLHLAGALEDPTAGHVRVDGVDLATLGPKGRAQLRHTDVGYVFQRLNLIVSLTALENVMLPLEVAGTRTREARVLAAEALAEVGLPEPWDRFPDDFSGGQQQRIAVARAVVGTRALILADEPTGALDSHTGEDVLRVLRERCDEGVAGLLVTHEARHAAWADRVVFLRDGVVVDSTGRASSPEDLLAAGTPR
jgi:putative ABC transport system ATP-binding protein